MSRKINIAVLFGGRSAEHEVSIQSVINIVESMDKEKYLPFLLWIDRDGRWFFNKDKPFSLSSLKDGTFEAFFRTEAGFIAAGPSSSIVEIENCSPVIDQIDVVFPVLHGPYGEDGSVQGLAKLANLPCVGAGILGSAIGMDKDVMKRLLRDASINIADFIVLKSSSFRKFPFELVKERLGLPVYIKPANLGSSVGIARVDNEADYNQAVLDAFNYDEKVIVEENIKGREIECSVLGNDDPSASIPGEIIPEGGFYSYSSKYTDASGAVLKIPAEIDGDLSLKVRELAVRVFQVLDCKGMARVDMFLTEGDTLLVNEINTIPGFTKISMYPKLWDNSGISYTELVDRLISLAMDEFETKRRLKTTYLT